VEAVPDARLAEALKLIEDLPDIPLRTLDAVMARAAVTLGMKVAFFGATDA
jgi:hypothetical protein